MNVTIPMGVRFRRLVSDIKAKYFFAGEKSLSDSGQALVLHLKNLYRGSEAASDMAKEMVNDIMKDNNLTDRRPAIWGLFLYLYSVGAIDEIELGKLALLDEE